MKTAMWKHQFSGAAGHERFVFSDKYARAVDGTLQSHGSGLSEEDVAEAAAAVYVNFQGRTRVTGDEVKKLHPPRHRFYSHNENPPEANHRAKNYTPTFSSVSQDVEELRRKSANGFCSPRD